MNEVLFRMTAGLGISILINAFAYFILDSYYKNYIILIFIIAFCCAFPMILGYLFSYLITFSSNAFLHLTYAILLIFNAIMMLYFSILFTNHILAEPFVLLFSCYLVLGYYVLYETMQDNSKSKPQKETQDNILDDNL